MYKEIIRERLIAEYKILSIGCGSAIDYYGLYFANDRDISTIKYEGIDPVNWKYRKSLDNENFTCKQESIVNLKFSSADYNIIFFPKSLSEISEDDLNIFITNIEQGIFASEILYLVSSTMDKGFIYDQQKYERIKDALVANGFTCHNYQKTQEITDKPSFAHFDPDFFYPDEVKDFIIELNKKCPTYSAEGKNCDSSCKEQLTRYPILKTTHVSFQINKFERK